VVHVKPPGDEVAVYEVTGEPFGAAAVHASVTLPLPAVALLSVGAPGVLDGAEGVADMAFDAGPVPIAFVAVTVNVYAVPLSRPTEIEVAVPSAVSTAPPPGEIETV